MRSLTWLSKAWALAHVVPRPELLPLSCLGTVIIVFPTPGHSTIPPPSTATPAGKRGVEALLQFYSAVDHLGGLREEEDNVCAGGEAKLFPNQMAAKR